MKLSELIEAVRVEKPNAFKLDTLVSYVNEIESTVQEYLNTPERVVYTGKDGNMELIVPAPYDALYKSCLKAKIDYANEEYESYGNNQAQHESDMRDFRAWAVREGKVNRTLPAKIRNWW